MLERIVLTLAVCALFVIGYFGAGLTADPSRARELVTPVDRMIPFAAWSVWIYLWVFPAAFLPLFVVRCRRLFRRTLFSYALAITISVAVFVAFPVTSRDLRVDRAVLDVTRASDWAVAVLYDLDPPYNLFPSLHLSIAALAAGAVWLARRGLGAATMLGVVLVGVSICTVKQHFVLDGLGGLALAAAIHAVVLRGYRPDRGTSAAFGWRGPAAYAVLLVVLYGALAVLSAAAR